MARLLDGVGRHQAIFHFPFGPPLSSASAWRQISAQVD